MLKVVSILCRPGKMDNYAYLLIDENTKTAAVLDASEADPVIRECERQNVKPQFLLNTHHHFDHVEGNLELKSLFGAKIVGAAADSDRIDGLDIGLVDGDVFMIGDCEANIMSADGHTLGHILWYFPKEKALFTGDTLFNLSIGGLFEGSPEQMWKTLQKIKKLPDDVLFYPGHEYTAYGLSALQGKNGEKYAQKTKERLAKGYSAAPVSLGEEKMCNPYLCIENCQDFCRMFE